jgi:hypothetical protein
VKLTVPEAFLAKDQTKERGTLLFIKEAMAKALTSKDEQA